MRGQNPKVHLRIFCRCISFVHFLFRLDKGGFDHRAVVTSVSRLTTCSICFCPIMADKILKPLKLVHPFFLKYENLFRVDTFRMEGVFSAMFQISAFVADD
jgi:hypothetical protein